MAIDLPLYDVSTSSGPPQDGPHADNVNLLVAEVEGQQVDVIGRHSASAVGPLVARAVRRRHYLAGYTAVTKTSDKPETGDSGEEGAGNAVEYLKEALGMSVQAMLDSLGLVYKGGSEDDTEPIWGDRLGEALTRADQWLREQQRENDIEQRTQHGQAQDLFSNMDGWGLVDLTTLLRHDSRVRIDSDQKGGGGASTGKVERDEGRDKGTKSNRLVVPSRYLSFADRLCVRTAHHVSRCLVTELHSLQGVIFSLWSRVVSGAPGVVDRASSLLSATWWASHRWRMRHMLLRHVHSAEKLLGPVEQEAMYTGMPVHQGSGHPLHLSQMDSRKYDKASPIVQSLLSYICVPHTWEGEDAAKKKPSKQAKADDERRVTQIGAAVAALRDATIPFGEEARSRSESGIASMHSDPGTHGGRSRSGSQTQLLEWKRFGSDLHSPARDDPAAANDAELWRHWGAYVEPPFIYDQDAMPVLYMDSYLPCESELKDDEAPASAPEDVSLPGRHPPVHLVILLNGMNVSLLYLCHGQRSSYS